MEEGKQAAAAVGADSSGGQGTLPAGMRPGSGLRRAKLKLLGLAISVVILLVAVGVGGYLWLHKSSAKKPTTTSTTTSNKVPTYFSTLNSQEQVTYYLSQKNYTAAVGIYNNQLTAAKTADDKAQANMGLSGIYTIEQDNQTAYQYALKAYNDEVTVQTARTVAGAATNTGDKKDAAKYYQVAINLLPQENLPSNQYDYTLRELQANLQEVSQ